MDRNACPRCGEEQGFLAVQRVSFAGGGGYERYYCCHCSSSFETDTGAGWAGPEATAQVPATPSA